MVVCTYNFNYMEGVGRGIKVQTRLKLKMRDAI
jgi:hypothetical protein